MFDVDSLAGQAGLTSPALGAVLVIVTFCAVLRGLTGFGFAIAAVPLLSSLVDPRLAVAVAALLQLVIGVLEGPGAWRQAHRPLLSRLLLGAVVGTPLGMIALRLTSPGPQRLVVAVAALIALFVAWRGPRLRSAIVRGNPTTMGVASGLLNGLAAMPGPPAVAYFMSIPLGPTATRASLILYFAATALFAVASGLAAGVIGSEAVLLALVSLPALVLGNGLGGLVFRAGGESLFRSAGLAVLAVGAAAAGYRGLAAVAG
ncbi:MAG: sulfite exporter TauE/SafE family protein [Caulobacteraceae bacterium]|nr:sulfite exporter TauE/SafE family protein [Caulobacteraceae bacterium]